MSVPKVELEIAKRGKLVKLFRNPHFSPHARINLTTNTFKRHGPMAAELHTLKLAPYIKHEDPHG